jgi:hypothetical protein
LGKIKNSIFEILIFSKEIFKEKIIESWKIKVLNELEKVLNSCEKFNQ